MKVFNGFGIPALKDGEDVNTTVSLGSSVVLNRIGLSAAAGLTWRRTFSGLRLAADRRWARLNIIGVLCYFWQ